ncbi:MAG: hypothetical protein WC508_02435 [Patescibacteria group bacterium]
MKTLQTYWAKVSSNKAWQGRLLILALFFALVVLDALATGIITLAKLSAIFLKLTNSWQEILTVTASLWILWLQILGSCFIVWRQKQSQRDKTGVSVFALRTWRSWWQDAWGANAIQGQIITACLGMSLVIVDAEIGNTINFDQYKTFSQVLVILPLLLPAAGLCTNSEGFGKFVLTFGTSLIFGGYPGFMIKGLIGLGHDANNISSFSVAAAAVTMIAMYWCFFQIGHLSRFFLYMCTNIFRPSDFPKSASKVIWMLIFVFQGSLARSVLSTYPVSNWELLFGPQWYTGDVDKESLWRKVEVALLDFTADWSEERRILWRTDLDTAHRDILEYAKVNLQQAVRIGESSRLYEQLGALQAFLAPPASA